MYLLFIGSIIVTRVALIIPNKKYESILNDTPYFVSGCILAILFTLFISISLKNNKSMRIKIIIPSIIVIFGMTIFLFYWNLPRYSYEMAAEKVAESYSEMTDEEVTIRYPDAQMDKVKKYDDDKFLQKTRHSYYIHLIVGTRLVVFIFDPNNGNFEQYTGDRTFTE